MLGATILQPGPEGWTLSQGVENDRDEPMGHPYARHCGKLAWTRASEERGMIHALVIDRRGDYGGCYAIVPAWVYRPAPFA
jgi:hypothetical protein